jgi:glycosyltransferase involved in cell wall biosynthesis
MSLSESPVKTLTVVVPVYNEAATLRESLNRLLKVEMPLRTEVLIVDDGSTDGGLDSITDLEADGQVRVFRHKRNLGKSRAVLTGIERATGDYLTVLDADLEYDPQDYKRLLHPLLGALASVAYGTRTFSGHTAFSFWYVIGNRLLSLWASFLFNTWLTDVETCLKVAPLEEWRSLNLSTNRFGIEAEATGKFLRRGHRIYEVPISYQARTRAEGKKLMWTDGLLAFWILFRIRLFGR